MADGIVSSPLDPGLGQVVLPDTAAQDGSLSAVTRLAEGLMQEARQELAQAEAKSVWLLSAAVIALGAVISALVSGSASPSSLKSPVAQAVLWIGFASAAAGVYWLAMSLMPKLGGDAEKHRLNYFGHAAMYGGKNKDRESIRAELGAALVAVASRPDDLDRLADRLFDISSIVLRKYRRIRKAIQALGLSAVLVGLAIALESLLN
ncbi:MAG: hypothetical protein QOJ52_15 [Acidimicrobiaceae bacterium]|nr:hypothetical protein [Acidimicrobiaceae bacterium]MDQ1366035.1 hypothetical protein [Acidimicrobiaceae bacterium]MDQ1401365.1 hypothetical protein [Acidimicrobiaceae bacterium]MDQ1418053.1 hypothetical protein [Acidimicrobiaceae bacterium]